MKTNKLTRKMYRRTLRYLRKKAACYGALASAAASVSA